MISASLVSVAYNILSRFDYTLKSPVSTFSKKGEENIAYLNKGYEYELMSSCAGDMQSGLRIKVQFCLKTSLNLPY